MNSRKSMAIRAAGSSDRKAKQPGEKGVTVRKSRRPGVWLLLPALLLATLAAYYPA
jgi:hypothetical protein